jgi:hypothetical protein
MRRTAHFGHDQGVLGQHIRVLLSQLIREKLILLWSREVVGGNAAATVRSPDFIQGLHELHGIAGGLVMIEVPDHELPSCEERR